MYHVTNVLSSLIDPEDFELTLVNENGEKIQQGPNLWKLVKVDNQLFDKNGQELKIDENIATVDEFIHHKIYKPELGIFSATLKTGEKTIAEMEFSISNTNESYDPYRRRTYQPYLELLLGGLVVLPLDLNNFLGEWLTNRFGKSLNSWVLTKTYECNGDDIHRLLNVTTQEELGFIVYNSREDIINGGRPARWDITPEYSGALIDFYFSSSPEFFKDESGRACMRAHDWDSFSSRRYFLITDEEILGLDKYKYSRTLQMYQAPAQG